jgi:DNA-directed RNA polymerase subunit RPC12/RpoP
MLITCPECQKEMSDTAASCPHCGFAGKVGPPTLRCPACGSTAVARQSVGQQAKSAFWSGLLGGIVGGVIHVHTTHYCTQCGRKF